MEALELCACTRLSSHMIALLLTVLPLREIHLNRCWKIDDMALFPIIDQQPPQPPQPQSAGAAEAEAPQAEMETEPLLEVLAVSGLSYLSVLVRGSRGDDGGGGAATAAARGGEALDLRRPPLGGDRDGAADRSRPFDRPMP